MLEEARNASETIETIKGDIETLKSDFDKQSTEIREELEETSRLVDESLETIQQAMDQALGELEESTNNSINQLEQKFDESITDVQESVDEAKEAAEAAEASAKRAAEIASGLESFNIKKVDVLPTTGEERTMYLIAVDGEGMNFYEEYLWFNDTGYEYIGNTKVDLSGYATTQELTESIANVEAKINRYTLVETYLYADGWNGNVYNMTVNGVTESSVQDISFGKNITKEEMKAAQKANIVDGGQSANTIVLIAYGTVPTIDIPVRVLIKGIIVDG